MIHVDLLVRFRCRPDNLEWKQQLLPQIMCVVLYSMSLPLVFDVLTVWGGKREAGLKIFTVIDQRPTGVPAYQVSGVCPAWSKCRYYSSNIDVREVRRFSLLGFV